MSDQPQQPEHLLEAHELIVQLLEHELSEPQVKRLEELVRQYPDVRQLYVLYMHQRCLLATTAQPGESLQDSGQLMNETMVTSAITLSESEESSESTPAPPLPPMTKVMRVEPDKSNIRRFGWAAAIALIVGLTLLFWPRSKPPVQQAIVLPTTPTTLPQQSPTPPPPAIVQITQPTTKPQPVYVATLTRQIGVKWNVATTQPSVGDGFEQDTSLAMSSGFAELTFKTGTSVVVEAPADFVVETNSLFLKSGRIAAIVPVAGHGFFVQTQQSTVTDLGTELGVAINADGTTQVDVFKGKVTAKPLKSSDPPTLLVEGKAAAVSENKIAIDPRGASPQKFVRRLNSDANVLDLVDLVAGGDGTTHLRGPAIDVRDGKYGMLDPVATITSGDGLYHRVDSDVIDGCFLPAAGEMQIDSAGNHYNFAASGRTYDCIRTSHIDRPLTKDPPVSSVLDGVDYYSDGHGMLLLHANAGLTIDLNAVRRLYPNKTLTSFHSRVGNTATQQRNNKTQPRSDALVLVDGKVRFQRLNFTLLDHGMETTVPLNNADHFLTLVMIDHINNTQFDWDIFADPTLNLSNP